MGASPPFLIGGTVSGLEDGSSVTLLNNGGDALKLRADGSFSFAAKVSGAYAVTIERQPLWQDCTASNGAGAASADVTNVRIACTSSAVQVTTFAGTGASGNADGPAGAATFGSPLSVAMDSSGNLYVGEAANSDIRKITPAGDVTTLAILPSGIPQPYGMAVAPNGTVYVSVYSLNQIYTVTPAGVVTPFAGDGNGASVDGSGLAASLHGPAGLALDGDGNLYVAERHSGNVRKISPSGEVSTHARAVGSLPFGIAMGADGNVYVSDVVDRVIRRVTPAGVVTLFAGSGAFGSDDGIGAAASFVEPLGLAVTVDGALFVAQAGPSPKIRRISPAGVVTTLAGNGIRGSTDGTGTAASFISPAGLVFDPDGSNLYVVDSVGENIRKIGRP